MLPKTDFETHRIQGFTNATGERIDVPLISHIADNLWSGGCIEGVKLPKYIDIVISLYPWEKYRLHPHQVRTEITMHDHDGMPDIDQLHQIADTVNTHRKDGKNVLVHCQAGLNRSGLVAGLALIKAGMTAENAIKLLRNQRCKAVLCNKTFRDFLLSKHATRRRR